MFAGAVAAPCLTGPLPARELDMGCLARPPRKLIAEVVARAASTGNRAAPARNNGVGGFHWVSPTASRAGRWPRATTAGARADPRLLRRGRRCPRREAADEPVEFLSLGLDTGDTAGGAVATNDRVDRLPAELSLLTACQRLGLECWGPAEFLAWLSTTT